jgi:hypothetical protein
MSLRPNPLTCACVCVCVCVWSNHMLQLNQRCVAEFMVRMCVVQLTQSHASHQAYTFVSAFLYNMLTVTLI